MRSIKDYLLIEYHFVDEFIQVFHEHLLGILVVVFLLAIIYELFLAGDLMGIVKRTFLAIVVILFFSTFHKLAVMESFKLADRIARTLSDNLFLEGIVTAINNFEDLQGKEIKGSWDWIKFHLLPGTQNINSLLTVAIVFLGKLFMVVTKMIYTLVYHINYALIAIPAVFSIITPFKDNLIGVFKTTLWCMTMPFVVLFLLFVLNWQITHYGAQGEMIGKSLEGTVALFAFLLMLPFSGLMAMGLLSSTGAMGSASIAGIVIGNKLSDITSKQWNFIKNNPVDLSKKRVISRVKTSEISPLVDKNKGGKNEQ